MNKLESYKEELHELYEQLKGETSEERKLIINRRINFLAFTILRIERQERLEKLHKKSAK